MILEDQKFIYLHVQKTGGNSISSALLPFSSDQKKLKKHQDGTDRFGIEGDITPRKHAWLQEYQGVLGSRLDDYDVVTSVRDPLDRAISMYFSPHRWYKRDKSDWVKVEPFWCFERFNKIVSDMYRVVDFLKVNNATRVPDHVIRFESIQEDFDSLIEKYELPINSSILPHVNKSAASSILRDTAYNDKKVHDLVKDRFKEDYEILEKVNNQISVIEPYKVASG